MNLFKLSLSYLRRRKLNALLNVLLLALGIATIVVLLLFSRQVERGLTQNAQGIDAVVGATGSPIQLILSSVYHMDAPTGNISVEDARPIMQHPMVKAAIPLALGDSYRGYRIVGSTPAYPAHYGGEVAEGRLWEASMEAAVGAEVARQEELRVGDEIVSSHGLTAGGAAHGDQPMTIVGVLEETGTVLDRLVLTSVETVWDMHAHEGEHEEGEEHGAHEGEAHADEGEPHGDGHETHAEEEHHSEDRHAEDEAHQGEASADDMGAAAPTMTATPPSGVPPMGAMPMQRPPGGASAGEGALATDREYTALLITYGSPIAAATFPRYVNTQTDLQAASPAFETTRVLSLLGVGLDAIRAFGVILIFAAALGVFIALLGAMKERQYDLAMMRTLGASRGTLLRHVLLEGVALAGAGAVLGLVLGHVAAGVLGAWLGEAQQVEMTGLAFAPAELWLLALAVGVGLVAALLPAVQAYRVDIARTLARG